MDTGKIVEIQASGQTIIFSYDFSTPENVNNFQLVSEKKLNSWEMEKLIEYANEPNPTPFLKATVFTFLVSKGVTFIN